MDAAVGRVKKKAVRENGRVLGGVRQEWLVQIVREFQVLAGELIDADYSADTLKERVDRLLDGVGHPRGPLEALLCDGLCHRAEIHRRTCSTVLVSRSLAQRAEEILEREYVTALTVRAVARQLGVHPKTLSAEFRRAFNVSFCQRLLDIRLTGAARLLVSTDIKLEAAAYSAGFTCKATFYRAFIKHFGITPAALRRRRSSALIRHHSLETIPRSSAAQVARHPARVKG